MRLLVDATCAGFGGIRTYVEHTLATWPAVAPHDDLHVLVAAGSDLPLPASMTRHTVRVPRPSAVSRPLAQTAALLRLERRLRPDAVLATLPSTTLTRLSTPTTVVVYDLRHELAPEQFTRGRRLMRRVSYSRGYRIADHIISISGRSLRDLHGLHPWTRRTPGTVVHLGADHVDRLRATAPHGRAVAFGHHTNKNPGLVLDAWQRLVVSGTGPPPLSLIGIDEAARPAVARAVSERGLQGHVGIDPFLSDADFATTLAGASMIVFPSSFEGFGLPVAEGMRLRIPVVIGPEDATTEVAGGHAFRMSDWTSEALACTVRAAASATPAQLDAAAAFAERYTWRRVVLQTREVLTSS